MKLLYQGNGLDPQHVQRQRRRTWFYSVCWEAIGVLVFCLAFWAFIVLMFVM